MIRNSVVIKRIHTEPMLLLDILYHCGGYIPNIIILDYIIMSTLVYTKKNESYSCAYLFSGLLYSYKFP